MLIEERKESYEACVRIRNKAPNLNLKCEDLLEGIVSNEENEQIKLRKLIQKLSNGNNLRKD